jgi:integrase
MARCQASSAERPGLRPRTVELYRSLLRRHVTPWLGDVPLGKLDTPLIREWRARLLDEGVSATVTAKAYRLLRAVLMTAVNEDHLIARNPCQVRGADREVAGERPVLSTAEVLALADEVPARYRAMILLTTFASLRFGEVTALVRRDIDLDAAAVEVRRAFVEVQGAGLVAGPPKSRAGLRRVGLPRAEVVEMRKDLAEYVEAEPSSLVFTGPKGAPIRRGNARKLLRWNAALSTVGLSGIRFHDLRVRHEANDSVRAAIIYQHATTEADARIADSLDADIAGALAGGGPGADEDGRGVVLPSGSRGYGVARLWPIGSLAGHPRMPGQQVRRR